MVMLLLVDPLHCWGHTCGFAEMACTVMAALETPACTALIA